MLVVDVDGGSAGIIRDSFDLLVSVAGFDALRSRLVFEVVGALVLVRVSWELLMGVG